MFSHNPMHYAGRLAVAQHGFESVTRGILNNIDFYRSVLARHAIGLHTDLLRAEIDAMKSLPGDRRIVEQIIDAAPSQPSLLRAVQDLELRLHEVARLAGNGSEAAAEAPAMVHGQGNSH
jgi:hypothetical protein